jgi:hypothetical protein
MKQNTFRKGYTEYDYITKTIPFEYTEPTKEQSVFVRNVLFIKFATAINLMWITI